MGFELLYFSDQDGREVVADWLARLKDRPGQLRIRTRLNRVCHGNLGDHKGIEDGVYELSTTLVDAGMARGDAASRGQDGLKGQDISAPGNALNLIHFFRLSVSGN